MVRSRLLLTVAFAALTFGAGCQEDPEAAANKLFVEASAAMTEADAIKGDTVEELTKERDLLNTAVGNLEKITSTYPAASLAVDLAASGTVKGLVVADIKKRLADVEADLACAEKPQDGQCAVDRLVENELARALDNRKRAFFLWLLAANARFDDAMALAEPIKADDRSLSLGLAPSAIFSILLNDPSVIDRIIAMMPERDKDDVEKFVTRFSEDLQRTGWKVTKNLTPSFTVADAPDVTQLSANDVEKLVDSSLEGVDAMLKQGDLEGFRTKVVNLFSILDGLANGDDAEKSMRAYQRAQTILERALNTAFR